MPRNGIVTKLVLIALATLLSSATRAAEVSWLPGRSSPAGWTIQPKEPKATDVIHFVGPTPTYLNRSVAEKTLGGKPAVQIDPNAKHIELRFEPPPSESAGNFWNPVSGLQGSFGPLAAGQWQFSCTQAPVTFSLSFAVGGSGAEPNAVYYVDARAKDIKSGSSWANAFVYLQDALAAATAGSEIHVAKGTYRPDEGAGMTPGDPTAAFQLKSGVVLKGGYAGLGARDPNERNVAVHETVLSGDLQGNDGPFVHPANMVNDPNRTDNSYHVVMAAGIDSTAVLDGFTITGGHGFGSRDPDRASYGGGIYNDESSPIIRDCLIIGNSVARHGGGVYTRSRCVLTLVECAIADNWGEWWGGGLANNGSEVRMERCLISGNATEYYGGGIHSNLGVLFLSNCILSGNMAIQPDEGSGGALYSYGTTAWLDYCTLVGNSARLGASMICDSSEPTERSEIHLSQCIVWGTTREIWSADQSPVIIAYSDIQSGSATQGNISSDPCFVEMGHWDLGGTPDDPCDDSWVEGDYHLRWDSPCVDAGDPREVPEANETDFAGRPRLYGAAVDMGAYELKNDPPVAYAPDAAGFCLTGDKGTVTLDASSSFDPEGTALTYRWYRSGQIVSIQAKFTMELPLGEHTFTLVVSDGVNNSPPEEVRATVTKIISAEALVSPSEMTRSRHEDSLLAIVMLPKGKRPSDVDRSEPMLLFPGSIKAVSQTAFVWFTGRTHVMARFNRAELMAAVPNNGPVELRLVGKLKDGQYFSGVDTVRIK